MPPIKINEPYWSAGHKFGWPGKTVGIGINRNELSDIIGKGDNQELEITVGKDPQVWVIKKEDARRLVMQYKSSMNIRNTIVCIIPWHAFHKKVELKEGEVRSEQKQIL